jgi:hypothetical protein
MHVTVQQYSDAPNRAGDPCRTVVGRDTAQNSSHVTLFWFQLTTHFCWDGTLFGPWTSFVKVTSRSTKVGVAVTSTGKSGGWSFVKNVTGVESHCFVSGYGFSGGRNRCSGNYEYDEGEFHACLPGPGCYQTAYPKSAGRLGP